jgi:hypothetical protein
MPTRKFPRTRGRREGRPDERAYLTAARSIPLTTIPHDLAIAPAIALRGHIFCRQFIPRQASRCGVRDVGSDHATIGGAQQNLASPPSRIRRTLLSPPTAALPLKGRRRLSDNPRCRLTEE